MASVIWSPIILVNSSCVLLLKKVIFAPQPHFFTFFEFLNVLCSLSTFFKCSSTLSSYYPSNFKNSRRFPWFTSSSSMFLLCPLKVRPSLPTKNITSIILSRRSWFFFAFLIHLVWFTNFCFELRLSTSIFCWKSTYAALASSCMLLLSWAWIFSICFFQFFNCGKHSPRNVEQQTRYKKYSVRWYWLAYPFSFRVSLICAVQNHLE